MVPLILRNTRTAKILNNSSKNIIVAIVITITIVITVTIITRIILVIIIVIITGLAQEHLLMGLLFGLWLE